MTRRRHRSAARAECVNCIRALPCTNGRVILGKRKSTCTPQSREGESRIHGKGLANMRVRAGAHADEVDSKADMGRLDVAQDAAPMAVHDHIIDMRDMMIPASPGYGLISGAAESSRNSGST